MHFRLLTLLLFVMLTGFGCDDVERGQITISDSFGSRPLQEMANGVYVRVPSQFRRARSYVGYQYLNGPASISLEVRDRPISSIERLFEDDALQQRGERLLELRPVVFYGNERAFYAVTEAKRKGVFKYLLAVEEEGKTYNIKALCSIRLSNALNMATMFEEALLSTEIRGYQAGVTDFARVGEGGDPFDAIYTRDGKYPTESADAAVVKSSLMIMPDDDLELAVLERVKEEVKQLNGGKGAVIGEETLSNGYILYATSHTDTLSAFAAILNNTREPFGAVFTGTAKTKAGVENIRDFVIKTTTKRQLGIR
ncbi:MAG: hypothetical protein AAF597_08615 [Bacteroidota bacterium]